MNQRFALYQLGTTIGVALIIVGALMFAIGMLYTDATIVQALDPKHDPWILFLSTHGSTMATIGTGMFITGELLRQFAAWRIRTLKKQNCFVASWKRRVLS